MARVCSTVDVGVGNRPGVWPLQGVAAVGHGISFDETGAVHGGFVGADGDHGAQQAARTRGALAFGRHAGANRGQQSVAGGGAHGQQLGAHARIQSAVFPFVEGQPFGDGRDQAFAAHLIGGAPQPLQMLQHRAVIDRLGATPPWGTAPVLAKQPDGIFAAVPADGAEFVEDGCLGAATGIAVALADGGQVIAARTNDHVPCSFR
jgi:hypothetical protein